MAYAGLLITLAGAIISVASLGITDSVSARLGIVLVGIVVSLVGICKFVNGAYLTNAIWKKGH
jgi:hypothetical protein